VGCCKGSAEADVDGRKEGVLDGSWIGATHSVVKLLHRTRRMEMRIRIPSHV
jgi:flagellar basal body rod protein FlgF